MPTPPTKHQFKPGQSGNPTGRKNDAEVRELCRQHTTAAVAALVRIMKSNAPAPARVSAAVAILDRGWGRPAVTIAGEGAEGQLVVQIITGVPRDAD